MTHKESIARTRASPGTGYLGKIPEGVWEVVEEAWEDPFSLASDYARKAREEVALAASLGWISIITPDGRSLTNRWHPTMEGLLALRNRATL